MAAAQGIYIFEFFKKVSIFWRVHSLTGLFWFKSIGPLEKYKCSIWPQCLGFRSAEHPHVQMKASHCRFNVHMSLKLGYNKYDWSWVQSVIVSLALREKVFFSVPGTPLKTDHHHAIKMRAIQLLDSLFIVMLYLKLLLTPLSTSTKCW